MERRQPVLADEGFDHATRDYAATRRRADAGPPATKQVLRDYLEGGVELSNDRTPAVAGQLFATEDLQGAVQSFLTDGPGRATFHGR